MEWSTVNTNTLAAKKLAVDNTYHLFAMFDGNCVSQYDCAWDGGHWSHQLCCWWFKFVCLETRYRSHHYSLVPMEWSTVNTYTLAAMKLAVDNTGHLFAMFDGNCVSQYDCAWDGGHWSHQLACGW